MSPLVGHEPLAYLSGPQTRRAEHLSVPLRRVGSQLATVEQDSPDEVEQCVAGVLRTRVGHRDDLPDFGTPPQAFSRAGVDLDECERALALWEPRADVALMRDRGSLLSFAQGLDVVNVNVES